MQPNAYYFIDRQVIQRAREEVENGNPRPKIVIGGYRYCGYAEAEQRSQGKCE